MAYKVSKYDLCSTCRRIRTSTGLTIDDAFDDFTSDGLYDIHYRKLNEKIGAHLFNNGGCKKCILLMAEASLEMDVIRGEIINSKLEEDVISGEIIDSNAKVSEQEYLNRRHLTQKIRENLSGMTTKCWEYEYDKNIILVVNNWFDGEQLYVNGQLQDQDNNKIAATLRGNLPNGEKIEAKIYSSFVGQMQCDMLINGKKLNHSG